jgi:hypothetical protein
MVVFEMLTKTNMSKMLAMVVEPQPSLLMGSHPAAIVMTTIH